MDKAILFPIPDGLNRINNRPELNHSIDYNICIYSIHFINAMQCWCVRHIYIYIILRRVHKDTSPYDFATIVRTNKMGSKSDKIGY